MNRVGIDTGGTFTDFVRVDERGLFVCKLPTPPTDPSRVILEGLSSSEAVWSAAGRPIDTATPRSHAAATLDVVHGSTVATNAVLERKGARVALVTTAGFEDVLRIGRQTRPELYNVFVAPRPRLVDPALTFGIAERLDADGMTLQPIDPQEIAALAVRLTASGADIVAVCLLHAYANPAHERAVSAQLRAAGLTVCASHEILPEYREYERWSTTVLNAYVTPPIDRYLGSLERGSAASSAEDDGAVADHAVERRDRFPRRPLARRPFAPCCRVPRRAWSARMPSHASRASTA